MSNQGMMVDVPKDDYIIDVTMDTNQCFGEDRECLRIETAGGNTISFAFSTYDQSEELMNKTIDAMIAWRRKRGMFILRD